MDKISIIIPCYSAENYVEHCLRSLICQTYKRQEIICFDNGRYRFSHDQNRARCRTYRLLFVYLFYVYHILIK